MQRTLHPPHPPSLQNAFLTPSLLRLHRAACNLPTPCGKCNTINRECCILPAPLRRAEGTLVSGRELGELLHRKQMSPGVFRLYFFLFCVPTQVRCRFRGNAPSLQTKCPITSSKCVLLTYLRSCVEVTQRRNCLSAQAGKELLSQCGEIEGFCLCQSGKHVESVEFSQTNSSEELPAVPLCLCETHLMFLFSELINCYPKLRLLKAAVAWH